MLYYNNSYLEYCQPTNPFSQNIQGESLGGEGFSNKGFKKGPRENITKTKSIFKGTAR